MSPIGVALLFLSICAIAAGAVIPQNPVYPFSDFTKEYTQRRDIVISSYSPDWSRLGPQPDGSKTIVTITGCGFSRESYAICVFDLSFTSYASRILDDETIICELPHLDSEYFETLPHWSRLDIFWGDQMSANYEQRLGQNFAKKIGMPAGTFLQNAWSYVGQFRWGPQLECSPLNPNFGPTSGSGAIQILGEGFDDPNLPSTLRVYFDDRLATSVSIVSSTTISVVPPSVPYLGVEALVSLIWTGNVTDHFQTSTSEIYLWSSELYRYGPEFIDITPRCSYVNGTRSLTINGRGFNDPLIPSSASSMLLFLSIPVTNNWDNDRFATLDTGDVVSNNVQHLQVVPSSKSDTQIVFTAPNWIIGALNFDTAFGALVGQSVSVDVQWLRADNKFINQPVYPFTENPQHAFTTLSYQLGPIFDRLDTTHWYYGGGDRVCVTGDCFLEPAVQSSLAAETVQLRVNSGSNLIWDQNSLYQSSTDPDRIICGLTILDADFCSSSSTFQVNAIYDYLGPRPTLLQGTYGNGPIINSFTRRERVVPTTGLITVSGSFLTYNSSTTGNRTWASITPTCAGGEVPGTWCSDHTLTSTFTATSFTATLPSAYFGSTVTVNWVFTAPNSQTCSPNSYVVTFGPDCSFNYYNGRLVGNDNFVINGTGFSAYNQARVYLCDLEPADITFVSTPYDNPQHSCLPVETDANLFELMPGTITNDNTITATTLGSFALRSNAWRGRRNWGQRFEVVVYFNSAQDSLFTGSMLEHNFSSCVDQTVTTSCETKASLRCGNYRFGPVVNELTPCQGPIGPYDTFVTPITVTGLNFVDDWADDFRVSSTDNTVTNTNVPRSANQHLILFGSLFQQPISQDSSISANQMTSQTIWNDQPWMGGSATKYQTSSLLYNTPQIDSDDPFAEWYPDGSSIGVFFDTCNTTMVPNLLVHWGPAFPACPMSWAQSYTTARDTTVEGYGCDIWGLPSQPYPVSVRTPQLTFDYNTLAPLTSIQSFSNYISVKVFGIYDFCGKGDCTKNLNSHNMVNWLGKCVIDGVTQPGLIDVSDDTNEPTIHCLIPDRPFGTQASVCLRFPDRTSADDTLFAYGEDQLFTRDPDVSQPPKLSTLGEDRLFQNDFPNYYEICIEDQHLLYKPYIELDAAKVDGHTSGLDTSGNPESVTINCVGCTLYDVTAFDGYAGSRPVFFFGGYPADTTSTTLDGAMATYIVEVPAYSAEFNTDVSISAQWDQNSVCGEDAVVEDQVSFFKVWADQTYHFGPVCTWAGQAAPSLYGTLDGNAPVGGNLLSTVSITGRNFRDCLDGETAGHVSTVGCTNDTYAGGCLVPMTTSSLKFEFSPLNSIGDPTGYGTPSCIHRYVNINLIGAQTYTNVHLNPDTLDIDPDLISGYGESNGDGQYFIVLPNRTDSNINCGQYSVTLFYPDAVVSNAAQRTITCPGLLTYDVAVTLSSFYAYDSGLSFYGYGEVRFEDSSAIDDDGFITYGNPFVDNYWTSPLHATSYDLFLAFGSTQAPEDSSTRFRVPPGTWGSTSSLTAFYATSFGGNRKCVKTGWTFHYGPEILRSSREDPTCASTGSVCLDYDDSTRAETVVITGRAFGCCGYNRNAAGDTQLFQTRCAFGNNVYYSNENTWVPTSLTVASGSTEETVTCAIPSSQEPSNERLTGYGLFFGPSSDGAGDSSAAEWCPGTNNFCNLGIAAANNNANRFLNSATESVLGVMGPICYGPKVLFPTTPYHVRYSGYAVRVNPDDVDVVAEHSFQVIGACNSILNTLREINNTQTITDIANEGAALVEEFIPWMTCNYAGPEGTERIYNTEQPAFGSAAATSTYCNSRLFAKQCGDGDDTFFVTFLNVTRSNSAYTPSVWTKSTSIGFTAESNVPLTATVSYGPVVNSFSVSGTFGRRDDFLFAGENYTVLYVALGSVDNIDIAPLTYDNRPTINTVISVSLDYIEDWIAPTNFFEAVDSDKISMWGTQRATCLFGTLSNDDAVSLIHQGNAETFPRSFVDDDSDIFPFNNYFTDLSGQSGNGINVNCNVPQGAHGVSFDSWGSVYVLLDPHIDQWTQLLSPEDAADYDGNFIDGRQDLTSYWHWTPYVEGALKDWSAPGFVEPIVFQGYGFENYQTFSCSFGTVAATATILNDRHLVCMTPPYLSPQTVDVTFTWGLSSTNAVDEYCGGSVNIQDGDIEAYNVCNLDNQCKKSFDCQNSTNSFVLPGFDITGIVSFCPKAGPIVGNTYIDFQSIGLENYNRVQCSFHFAGGDQIVDVVQRNTSTEILYSCITPATTDAEHVLVTVEGFYSDLWTAEQGVYSTQLGSFWFDFDLPATTSVSPASVTFGSSVTVTVNGNYFTGGSDPAPESDGPAAWNYYCQWQVPVTQDLLTLPIDGQAPSFANRLVSYATPVNVTVDLDGCTYYTTEFTCLTPNFAQFGHYYFEFVYDGIRQNIPAGFTQLFTVLPQTVTITSITSSGFLNASATENVVAIPEELTITGTGFAGGRINSDAHTGCYLCRFDDPVSLDTIHSPISVAEFVSATQVQCFAPYISVVDQLNAYFDSIPNANLPSRCRNKPTPTKTVAQCMAFYCKHSWNQGKSICNPPFPIGVTVSHDCGYTWSNSVDIDYHFPYPESASLAAPVLMLLLSLFSLFFFF